MNKKILFCTESSHIKSGFGNYTYAMLSRLHRDGYDVAELSSYRDYKHPKTEPWKIYPAALPKDHPNYKEYMSDGSNQFGRFVFDYVLLDYRPDIVIDFRDFWMFAYQEVSPLRPFYHWIVAPTIDSVPLPINAQHNINNANTVLTHTNWAQQQLKLLNINNLKGVINDSVDTDIFKPMDRNNIRIKYNISDNSFIIGAVLRNQQRKLIPDILSVVRQIIDNNLDKNILLYLHTSYPEVNGWNLPELLIEYNLLNNTIFTYRCKKCSHMCIGKFQSHKNLCEKCGSVTTMASVTNGVTQEELAEIYNLFDIYLQYAICEGFGIPQVEAVACGIPLITMNHGAMAEIGHKLDAILVDIEREFRDINTNGVRAYPNNAHTVTIINKLLRTTKIERERIGSHSREILLNNYSWDITYNTLCDIANNITLSGLHGQWDIPERISISGQLDVDYDGDNEKFVRYMVVDIIKDNFLMNTSYIQNMIYNLDNGIININNKIMPYTIHHAMNALDIYLKQKILLEKIRTKQRHIPEALHPIINY